MSCQRRCDVWKATDGQWYMLLGRFEHAEEEVDCDTFGPFSDEKALTTYLHKNHSNPGGYVRDDSGKSPPPAKITVPRRIRHV